MIQPILYSFRRCPYAMRARLALAVADIPVELREVVLRNKPAAMLAASPKATVPVLLLGEQVIDESLNIMYWALQQNDPEHWRRPAPDQEAIDALIDQFDSHFKAALDRYKYPSRHPDESFTREDMRQQALAHLHELEPRLRAHRFLFGNSRCLADMAILPFIRQFAHVDKSWFDAQAIPSVHRWLEEFLSAPLFLSIMEKYAPWAEGEKGVPFPPRG
ncbi:MAG: glutathione S-transferase [bacterium]